GAVVDLAVDRVQDRRLDDGIPEKPWGSIRIQSRVVPARRKTTLEVHVADEHGQCRRGSEPGLNRCVLVGGAETLPNDLEKCGQVPQTEQPNRVTVGVGEVFYGVVFKNRAN